MLQKEEEEEEEKKMVWSTQEYKKYSSLQARNLIRVIKKRLLAIMLTVGKMLFIQENHWVGIWSCKELYINSKWAWTGFL